MPVGISDQCQRMKNLSLGVKTPWSKSAKGVSSKGGRLRCSTIAPFWGKSFVNGRWPLPPGKGKSGAWIAARAGLRAMLAAKESVAAPSIRIARRDRMGKLLRCGRNHITARFAGRYDQT